MKYAWIALVMVWIWCGPTPGLVRAQVPEHGTFWSMQFTNRPPLPWNPFPHAEVFDLGSNHWAYNDLGVDYEQWRLDRKAMWLDMGFWLRSDSEAPPIPGGPNDLGFDPGVAGLAAYDYSTNDLWLEIIAFTNHTAALVIHPPATETNGVHDLFYTTNLTAPINWQFVERAIRTNVLVPDLCDQHGFFRLGRTNGELTVTTNVTPLQMAQMLVPPWVTVANASYTGSNVARGTFAGGHGCGLPIETGVVLSTGDIGLAVGTNNSSLATAVNQASSDADLDGLVAGGPTSDAAVLEFDIGSTNPFCLRFQYVFASEEYPEWIAAFNDPMAIFVSTNFIGTNWIIYATNDIALLPGADSPVSVSLINGGFKRDGVPATNPQFYVDNKDPDPTLSSLQPYSAMSPVYNIQLDGLTVLLTASIQISANVVTHIKIGIQDFNDAAFDSAVFLKNWEPCSCCSCH